MTKPDVERERALAGTFVRLADTLVSGFDLVELLDDLVQSAVSLFGFAAGGVLLADQRGVLHVMASSSEQARLVEVFEIQSDQGPSVEAFRTGLSVAVVGREDQVRLWPLLSAKLEDLGLGAAYAVPMRLRDHTIGAVNFFSHPGSPLPEGDLATAKALADVATIAILQYRASKASLELAEQLQLALSSRVMIEQAKGVLAERGGVDMETAFNLLRGYARRTNGRLADVAEAVVRGTLSPDLLKGKAPTV